MSHNGYPEYRPNGLSHSPIFSASWEQRKQTLAVLAHSSSILLLPCLYFYLWTKFYFWPFLIIYTLFFYLFDTSLENGKSIKRRSNWFRSLPLYTHFSNYFPIKLHKTVDLKPTFTKTTEIKTCYPLWTHYLPNIITSLLSALHIISKSSRTVTIMQRTGPRYMFSYHPHGVIAFGITGVFIGEGCKCSEVLPGIPTFLLTLTNQFMLPFYRDYILALGVGLVTRRGIHALIENDQSVAIVVGGAQESLYANPGLNSIVLNRRKGFIKVALKCSGISRASKFNDDEDDLFLVPSYGFGENSIHRVYYSHDKVESPGPLQKFQIWLKRTIGFTVPLVNSRSIFNYDFGLLPYRRSINVVFGEPIAVKRIFGKKPGDEVTDQEIDYYHEVYKNALIKLFNDNKKKFSTQWDEELKIVE